MVTFNDRIEQLVGRAVELLRRVFTQRMSAATAKRFAWISTAVFVAHAALHVLSYASGSFSPGIWFLPLAASVFIVFGAGVISFNKYPLSPRRDGENYFQWNRRARQEWRQHSARMIELVPVPVRWFVGLLFAYVFLNFFDHVFEDDPPAMLLMTGHMMIFSVIPAVYFAYVEPNLGRPPPAI